LNHRGTENTENTENSSVKPFSAKFRPYVFSVFSVSLWLKLRNRR
jgi:hypothetical protein